MQAITRQRTKERKKGTIRCEETQTKIGNNEDGTKKVPRLQTYRCCFVSILLIIALSFDMLTYVCLRIHTRIKERNTHYIIEDTIYNRKEIPNI